ncbi:hypothetical protein OF83DRAFT_717319 [Amylostereum chailletii]|nr:hypothetical protein OF83DRAFT_717319 [Amylostereum chailletii]
MSHIPQSYIYRLVAFLPYSLFLSHTTTYSQHPTLLAITPAETTELMDAYRNESIRCLIEVLNRAKAKKTFAELREEVMTGEEVDGDSVLMIGIDTETWLRPLANVTDEVTDNGYFGSPLFQFKQTMAEILEDLTRASVAFFESEGLKVGFLFMVESPTSLFGLDSNVSAAKLAAPPPLFLDFEEHTPLAVSYRAVLRNLICNFDPPQAVRVDLNGISLTAKCWAPQFSVQVAPHVGAAELARLSRSGDIHAIMGTDFSVLLYGASHFIVTPQDRPFAASLRSELDTFSAEQIMAHQGVALSRPGLVLTVMLSGILSSPLRLFTPQIALEIGRISHVAETLEKIIVDHGADAAETLLMYWRFNLRRLITCDPARCFGGPNTLRADSISEDSPDMDYIRFYLAPPS